MSTPRYTGPQFDPHVAWTKVKTSAMKRPYLDCGCRNSPGLDTYLHLGCPRIACKQHAEDPHECAPAEPEPAPMSLQEQIAASVDPISEALRATAYPTAEEQRMAEELESLAERWRATYTQPDVAFRHQVLGEWPPDPEPRADVRVMTPDEATRFDAHQRLSLECSRSRPMCSGCDGGAMDGFTCLHGCHNEPGAAPVDAALQPDPDVPSRRPWWWIW